MKKPLIIHPFLFATFPVLSLFAHNYWEIYYDGVVSEALLPITCCLIIIGLMLLGFGKVLKNYKKAGIILSVFTILFFSYGHFYGVMKDFRIILGEVIIGHNKIF